MTNLSATLTITNVEINTITPDIFDAQTISDFVSRIENLQKEAPAKWGKMDAGQMLKHSADTTLMTLGELSLSRPFIGRLIGRFYLKSVTKDVKHLDKNSPTHKRLTITEQVDFEQEKQRFLKLIQVYNRIDRNQLEGFVHPFYGKMSSKEWSIWIYKHVDHHLRQFGV